jgi:uncharacterized protein YraI/uncharacterized protein YceK
VFERRRIMNPQSKSCLLILVILVLVLVSCAAPQSQTATGIVRGVVYGDMNANGIVDTGEGPLTGVTVSLSGCISTTSQTTGSDGSFSFANVPTGACFLTVAKTGWMFSGSKPVTGYPLPVTPKAGQLSVTIAMAPVSALVALQTGASSGTSTAAAQAASATVAPTQSSTPTAVTPTLTASSLDVNCRSGPGTNWEMTSILPQGQSTPVLGRNKDGSWLVIDPVGVQCWVAAAVTTVSGDISGLPVIEPPDAVTSLRAETPGIIHTTNGCTSSVTFTAVIAVNGPLTAEFHWELYTLDGRPIGTTIDQMVSIDMPGRYTFPSPSYQSTCGNYAAVLMLTSPNVLTTEPADWTVEHP